MKIEFRTTVSSVWAVSVRLVLNRPELSIIYLLRCLKRYLKSNAAWVFERIHQSSYGKRNGCCQRCTRRSPVELKIFHERSMPMFHYSMLFAVMNIWLNKSHACNWFDKTNAFGTQNQTINKMSTHLIICLFVHFVWSIACELMNWVVSFYRVIVRES